MTTSTPTLVKTYFQLAAQGDSEAYLALFDDDAVVEDEGNTYRGIEAIRQWRADVPTVTYDITAVDAAADGGVVATATVTGDFPGSPFAGLRFHFVDFDGAKIRTLYIRT
jgi:ketosteroid isomerase-like protein